jgi:hypothetical protein
METNQGWTCKTKENIGSNQQEFEGRGLIC